MSAMQDRLNTLTEKLVKGTEIERLSDDPDVRQWLLMGRYAQSFSILAISIAAVALLLSVRP